MKRLCTSKVESLTNTKFLNVKEKFRKCTNALFVLSTCFLRLLLTTFLHSDDVYAKYTFRCLLGVLNVYTNFAQVTGINADMYMYIIGMYNMISCDMLMLHKIKKLYVFHVKYFANMLKVGNCNLFSSNFSKRQKKQRTPLCLY